MLRRLALQLLVCILPRLDKSSLLPSGSEELDVESVIDIASKSDTLRSYQSPACDDLWELITRSTGRLSLYWSGPKHKIVCGHLEGKYLPCVAGVATTDTVGKMSGLGEAFININKWWGPGGSSGSSSQGKDKKGHFLACASLHGHTGLATHNLESWNPSPLPS